MNQSYSYGSNMNIEDNRVINGSTTYDVRIVMHSENTSSYSEPRRITTMVGPPKDFPRDIQATRVDPSTLRFSWRVRCTIDAIEQ